MKCKQCDKEFENVRKTAKYCSPKCRKLAFSKDSVPVSVPEKSADGGQIMNWQRIGKKSWEEAMEDVMKLMLGIPNHHFMFMGYEIDTASKTRIKRDDK